MKGGVLILFFGLAFSIRAQVEDVKIPYKLLNDENRKNMPYFPSKGVKPGGEVELYVKKSSLRNSSQFAEEEEELFAIFLFDERKRLKLSSIRDDKDIGWERTIFEYTSDSTYEAVQINSSNKPIHNWKVIDGELVEEDHLISGMLLETWKLKKAPGEVIIEEKYNSRGKLREQALLRPDSIDNDRRYCYFKRGKLEAMAFYHFDDKGNTDKIELLDRSDLETAARRMKINKSDLCEADPWLIRTAVMGLVKSWDLKYDENGELTRQTLLSSKGEELGDVKYILDEKGNPRSIKFDLDLRDLPPVFIVYRNTSGFDENQIRFFYEGQELLNYTSEWHYDQEGRVSFIEVEEMSFYLGGGIRKIFRCVYK